MDKNWMMIPPKLNKVWIGVSGERVVKGFSKAIETYQGTNYSHAFAMYWSRDLNDFIITNCHGTSVQLDLASQFDKTTLMRRVWEIDVSTDQRRSFIHKMVELDGAPYSPVHQMAWLVVARTFHMKWSPFADKDKSFWCSEYADVMQKSVDVPTSAQFLNIGRNTVTPQDNVKSLALLSKCNSRVKEIKF